MAQARSALSADDWAAAGLIALREGGLSAVAVQSLAKRLGVTKGSFYWHFASRDALVAATLALWEHRATEAKIRQFDREPDPVERLRMLLRQSTEQVVADSIESNLRAATDHPLVEAALRRVVERRIAYTIGLFEEIGFSRTESIRRGMLGYLAYTGIGELTSRLPGVLPFDAVGGVAGYVESTIALVLRDRPPR